MAILRQNEPAKRPSFEAQVVISNFLTELAMQVRLRVFRANNKFTNVPIDCEAFRVQGKIPADGSHSAKQ